MNKQKQTFAILKNAINDVKYGDKIRCVVNKQHISHLDKLIQWRKLEKEAENTNPPPGMYM